jgi:multidrug efflux pump subunit AcrB
MRNIIETFIKYPAWSNSVILTAIVFGIAAYVFSLKKSFFPEVEPSQISVNVVLPGASPEEMEEGVTIKIEEAVKGIEGIKEVTSSSSENSAKINIFLYKDYDADEVMTEVKNAVDRIASFPADMEKPVVFKARPRTRVLTMNLYGDAEKLILKQKAEEIEDTLLASGFISNVTLEGFPELEISVEVPEAVLLRHKISFDAVANAIRQNNRDISAGTIKTKDEEILIRSRAKEKVADRIGDIVLRADNAGGKLFLRDVAVIKEQFADVPFELTFNGKKSVSLSVNKLPEEDIQKISEYCNAFVSRFNAREDNIRLAVSYDGMNMLGERLDMLISNGLTGLALVVLCLGLFLNLRLSFWVAAGIPISFLGMFVIVSWLDVTINMLSLFGMIVVVGILVDDGIVISENIYSHFERGKSARQAALDGTLEVLPSVITSVLTTMVAFVPLMMLEGMEFWKELAIVVIVCLGVSLVEAFFVLPAHLANERTLKRKEKVNIVREKINQGIEFVRNWYGRSLDVVVSYRYVFACVPFAVLFLVLGIIEGGILKFTFFPSIPFDQFQVDLAFKPGTREEKVKSYLTDFEKKIWEVNEELKKEFEQEKDFVANVIRTTGSISDGTENGSHAGQITVNLQDMDNRRFISSFDIANRVREKIGKIPEAEKFKVAGAQRFGKAVSVSLLSKDFEMLENAKNELKAELQKFTALADITDNAKVGRRELMIELLPKAYFLGLTHAEITKQIRQGFFGEEVQRLQKGTDEVRVWVRYPESDRSLMSQFDEMKIKTPDGKAYPLSELVNYKVGRGVVDIKHFNGAREILIEADLADQTASPVEIMGKVASDIMPGLLAKYPKLEVSYGGQQKRAAQSLESMKKVLPVALFIILLIIALTFRSFSQAFMIMLQIPLGVLCAMLGHWIEDKPMSIFSWLGVLALSGVIINDSVVFLDRFNSNLREGMSLKDAIQEAGKARFRAIMLTSLTTVAGLYPLILEKSFQAQFLIPMAVSLAYGVLFGTFFILFIFPVFISVGNDIRRLAQWIRNLGTYVASGNEDLMKFPSSEGVEPIVRETFRLEKEV